MEICQDLEDRGKQGGNIPSLRIRERRMRDSSERGNPASSLFISVPVTFTYDLDQACILIGTPQTGTAVFCSLEARRCDFASSLERHEEPFNDRLDYSV